MILNYMFLSFIFSQDDNTMLRYVNDTHRTVYAYEMLPPPTITDDVSTKTQSNDVTSSSTVTSSSDGAMTSEVVLPNNAVSSSSSTVTSSAAVSSDVTSTMTLSQHVCFIFRFILLHTVSIV